jgi:glycosyltransferase involved in cell wall biosynthesis
MAEHMVTARPIHLLVLGMAWPPETFLERLLTGLAGRGYEITVSGPAPPRDANFRRSGFHWLTIPSASGPGLLRLGRQAGAVIAAAVRSPSGIPHLFRCTETVGGAARFHQLARLAPLAGRRWDLIYFPWNATAVEMLPAFDLGIPVVVSCRGSQLKVAPHNPTRTAIREGLTETFRRATVVHCVSQDILDEARRYGLDPDKADLIRPAVDAAFFCPALPGAPKRLRPTFRVVTIGGLNWKKGHEFALVAVSRLKERGIPVRFEIIGDGPERQRVLYTIDDLDLNDRVEMTGRLGPEAIRERLRTADVFMLSSVSEGISNAVLEAMACGLPVLTTDCGGLREAVTDGAEGLVVPLRDPGAMADALARLASDPALCERMGRAARARAEQEFPIGTQLDRWDALCRRVAGTAA